MAPRELVENAVQRGSALAGEDREHVARLGEEPVEQRARHLVEARAGGDGVAVEQRQVLARSHDDPVDARVAARPRSPRRSRPAAAPRASRPRSPRPSARRGTRRARRDPRGSTRSARRARASRPPARPARPPSGRSCCSGSSTTSSATYGLHASNRSAVEGFIVWPPSITFPAPRSANSRAVPLARHHGDHARARALRRGAPPAAAPRAARSAGACPRSRPPRSSRPGFRARAPHRDRRCGRGPSAPRIAYDEQRVAKRLDLRLQRSRRRAARPRLRTSCSSGTARARGARLRGLVLPLGRRRQRPCRKPWRRARGRARAGPLRPRRRHRLRAGRRAAREFGRRASSPRSTRIDEKLGRLDLGLGCFLRRLCELPDDGQHRPLDRLSHRPVRLVAGGAEGPRHGGRVRRSRRAEHLGGPADDLRQDHPGVPAGRHQRRPRRLARQRPPVGGARRLERLHDPARS